MKYGDKSTKKILEAEKRNFFFTTVYSFTATFESD